MSLQYLKKDLSYEVDVFHAEGHGSFLQVDSIIFDGFGQACQKYPGKLAIFLSHLKKKLGMKFGIFFNCYLAVPWPTLGHF